MDAETNMETIRKIANLVSEKVGKSYAWIAKQKDDELEDLFGIGWYGGKELCWQGHCAGFCAVRVNDAAMALTIGGELDPLIVRLATEVMGYAPDSEQDLINRHNRAFDERHAIENELLTLSTRHRRLSAQIEALRLRLDPAARDVSTNYVPE